MFPLPFQAGDWVKQRGFVQHHLRVIQLCVAEDGRRFYQVFHTTLEVGYAHYSSIWADDLERDGILVQRARCPYQAQILLNRCAQLNGLPYAIVGRQDCESLQRYIQTANENDRWSPQVVGAGILIGLGIWFFGGRGEAE